MNTPSPCDTCKRLYVNAMYKDDPTYLAECWLSVLGKEPCKNGSHYEAERGKARGGADAGPQPTPDDRSEWRQLSAEEVVAMYPNALELRDGHVYVKGEQDQFVSPKDACLNIAEMMNGTKWDASLLDDIADALRRAGFKIGDIEEGE